MSDALTARIMLDEGLRLRVYDDATGQPIVAGSTVIGNPTIGYGCLLSAPGGITPTEASLLLEDRIASARSNASRLGAYRLVNNARQDALTELVFWIGFGGVQSFRQMLAALAAHDYSLAADQLNSSRLHAEAPERCERLADVLRDGVE